jgi:magnesium transporter
MQVRNRSAKVGLPPGSLVYVGNKDHFHPIDISVVEFNNSDEAHQKIVSHEDGISSLKPDWISWVNLNGVHDVHLLNKIGGQLDLHPLTIEDILNTDQRSKIEVHENYIFSTLKMIRYDAEDESFVNEQISIILKGHLIVTFQEIPSHIFDHLEKRILEGKGRIRKSGADYLFYAIFDTIIDGYFIVLEQLQTELDSIEEKLMTSQDLNVITDVHWLKKELLYIRKATSPVRDMINFLQREDSPFIQKQNLIFFRDAYDHCIQVHESVELLRDIVSGLIEVYLSSTSNRTNEIMKYLTVFASIFIPLTFVTGIYGMNFENMPELKWEYGYYFLLGGLTIFGLGLFFFYKKRKWL